MEKKHGNASRNPSVKKTPAKVSTPKTVKNSAAAPAGNLMALNVLFFLLLAISYVVFINNFFSIKELNNAFIRLHASWVISLQFVLYTTIYILFGYFGFRFIRSQEKGRIIRWLVLAGFAAIIVLHMLAFNKAFEDVDDNASYMIAAKSLVEKGAPYYLYLPVLQPDTDGAIGLPLMLIPVYLIWGMNYFPMEILIFLTMAGSVVMCFLLFRKMEGAIFGCLLALVYACHPYIVSFSSIIMTEIPFIFWWLLATWLALKYEDSAKLNFPLLILTVLAVVMTYLTRAIGSGFVLAVMLYFLIKSGIVENIKQKKPFYKDIRFLKFLLVSGSLFILMAGYQIWARSLGGSSQAETLAKMNLGEQFSKNLGLVWQVMGQNIFAGKLARFEVNPDYLQPVNILWALVFLFTLGGLVLSLWRRQLVALAFVFVMVVLLFGNTATQPIVVSRYLIVFTPFMIYFLFVAVRGLVAVVSKKQQFARAAGVIVLAFLLGNSFVGSAFDVQRTRQATLYSPSYQAFLDCAGWAGKNLPKDAIVASRKERIFYIFSDGLRGYKHVSSNEIARLREEGKTMEDFEKAKLQQMQDNNTAYVIIDTFNSSTVQLIFPIIQKNPDKFKLIKTVGDEQKGACYVFEVIKWWS